MKYEKSFEWSKGTYNRELTYIDSNRTIGLNERMSEYNSDNDTYRLAALLANNMAVRYMASNISDMMITDGVKKAEVIRDQSKRNINQMDPRIQEFRRDERAIYSAVYYLLEGYNGYKIVKVDDE